MNEKKKVNYIICFAKKEKADENNVINYLLAN